MMPRHDSASHHRPGDRRGFVLPFVIVAIAALSLLTMTLVSEGLQSVRGARAMMSAADADDAAETAISQALADFTVDSVWQLPIGQPRVRSQVLNGLSVDVRWQRHQPLFASLRASVAGGAARHWNRVARDHFRAVWFAPPPIPVPAAMTTNGPVIGREGTLISGADVALPTSPCSSARDTQSVAAVSAPAIAPSTPGAWPGAPIASAPHLGLLTQLQQIEPVLRQRMPLVTVSSAPRTLPISSGVRALLLSGDTVAITEPTEWTGLLVVRGHLVFTGTVRLIGLLLVLGSVDASAAALTIQGALISADPGATGVMLGGQSQLLFDRCAVQMALATVSRPSLGPFALWANLPPDRR